MAAATALVSTGATDATGSWGPGEAGAAGATSMLAGFTFALHTLARFAVLHGDLERAARLCDEALLPYRQHGARRHAAPVLSLLGLVTAQRGDVHGGVELLREGSQLFAQAGDRHGMDRAFATVAELATDEALTAVVARWRHETGMQSPHA